MQAKDPKNRGYLAEQLFFQQISGHVQNIKQECDLKRCFGWDMTSIDFLLETDSGIIPVQIKYRGTRRRENNAIKNFLNSVNKLSVLYNKPVLFGMWLSRLKPFDDNELLLKDHNIQCVDYYHDLTALIDKGVQYILSNL